MKAIMTQNPSMTLDWFDHPLVHAPFVICMAGVLFWLVILWAFNREHWINEGKKPSHELKDEFWVMFGGIMLAVIWDSQALYLFDLVAEKVYRQPIDTPKEISAEMYLALGPIIERLYWAGKWAHNKIKKN